jgi:hypothetical protein
MNWVSSCQPPGLEKDSASTKTCWAEREAGRATAATKDKGSFMRAMWRRGKKIPPPIPRGCGSQIRVQFSGRQNHRHPGSRLLKLFQILENN